MKGCIWAAKNMPVRYSAGDINSWMEEWVRAGDNRFGSPWHVEGSQSPGNKNTQGQDRVPGHNKTWLLGRPGGASKGD